MTVKPRTDRSQRALELQEKGLSSGQIKERLGFNSVQATCNAIIKAKQLRAKAVGEVQA